MMIKTLFFDQNPGLLAGTYYVVRSTYYIPPRKKIYDWRFCKTGKTLFPVFHKTLLLFYVISTIYNIVRKKITTIKEQEKELRKHPPYRFFVGLVCSTYYVLRSTHGRTTCAKLPASGSISI